MIKRYIPWFLVVCMAGGWIGVAVWSTHITIKPYNGDVMAQRIPDSCDYVPAKYLGGLPDKSHNVRRQLPLDEYMALKNELDKCIAESRIDVH